MAKGGNTLFITLMPKEENSKDLNKYVPIFVVGGVYRIVAKILSNRLKRVMHKSYKENTICFH